MARTLEQLDVLVRQLQGLIGASDPSYSDTGYLDIGPVRIAWGNFAGKNGDQVVKTFPAGGFSGDPAVFPVGGRTYQGGGGGTYYLPTVDDVTPTQATFRAVNLSDSTVGGTAGETNRWIAIGAKP